MQGCSHHPAYQGPREEFSKNQNGFVLPTTDKMRKNDGGQALTIPIAQPIDLAV